MLEQAGSMFDDMEGMLNRIKKKVYGERMDFFRKKNAQLFAEMTGFVEQAANQDQAKAKDQVEDQAKAKAKDQAKTKNQAEDQNQDQVEKRDKAATQVAKAFADAVEARFAKRGKISGRSQMDINLFMIYFVFPAILLTKSDCAVSLADAIRDEWRGRFRDSAQLDYATYEEISGTFKEKFLGLF